mmetsp:Transcript_48518/g.149767  ORF Transcript_48518/g.149767 Transcript_48518/m.149767 type:complete len:350 (+) Transcript_48518:107-1156(+)
MGVSGSRSGFSVSGTGREGVLHPTHHGTLKHADDVESRRVCAGSRHLCIVVVAAGAAPRGIHGRHVPTRQRRAPRERLRMPKRHRCTARVERLRRFVGVQPLRVARTQLDDGAADVKFRAGGREEGRVGVWPLVAVRGRERGRLAVADNVRRVLFADDGDARAPAPAAQRRVGRVLREGGARRGFRLDEPDAFEALAVVIVVVVVIRTAVRRSPRRWPRRGGEGGGAVAIVVIIGGLVVGVDVAEEAALALLLCHAAAAGDDADARSADRASAPHEGLNHADRRVQQRLRLPPRRCKGGRRRAALCVQELLLCPAPLVLRAPEAVARRGDLGATVIAGRAGRRHASAIR